jgi:chlorobactene glucosyltransferase
MARRIWRFFLWAATLGTVGFYGRQLWEAWLGERRTRTSDTTIVVDGPKPLVTIIVPARNEARNIRRCVASLLAQAYLHFEVVVVDDGSTDATPQILAEMQRSPGGERLRVVPAGDLPPGWAGKPHAMAVGAAHAHGDWLLFTDADTFHQPDALVWAMREATARGADLFSLVSQMEYPDVSSHVIYPIVVMGITAQYPPAQVLNPARATAIANGQYLLIRRAMYDATGGYAGPTLRASVVDDRDLAAAVKRCGGRVVVLSGIDHVSVCMYRNAREQWRGWGKNAYTGSRGGPLVFALMALGLPLGTMLPFILALVGMVSRRRALAIAGGLQTVAILAYRWQLDGQMRHSRLWGWTHPLGGAFMTALLARVAWRQVTGHGVEWSGRTYQVTQQSLTDLAHARETTGG